MCVSVPLLCSINLKAILLNIPLSNPTLPLFYVPRTPLLNLFTQPRSICPPIATSPDKVEPADETDIIVMFLDDRA